MASNTINRRNANPMPARDMLTDLQVIPKIYVLSTLSLKFIYNISQYIYYIYCCFHIYQVAQKIFDFLVKQTDARFP